MFRAKLVLLSLVGVLSAFGMLAATTSAAIKFEWQVNGGALAAGESREFTTTSDGKNFDFHSTLAGSNVLLLSHEISVEKGANIKGGKPGTNLETVVFTGVTADAPLANCLVESNETSPKPGTVKTKLLKTEIVESEASKQPVILFTPDTGTVFVALLLLNKSATETCPAGSDITANVGGSLLAQPLPALAETVNGDLDFEAPDKNFILSGGALNKAGLTFAGNAATLTGLALVKLTTGEAFGAF